MQLCCWGKARVGIGFGLWETFVTPHCPLLLMKRCCRQRLNRNCCISFVISCTFFFLNHPLQLWAESNNLLQDTSNPCHLIAALPDNLLTSWHNMVPELAALHCHPRSGGEHPGSGKPPTMREHSQKRSPSESVGWILSGKQLQATSFLLRTLVQCSFSLRVSRQGAGL